MDGSFNDILIHSRSPVCFSCTGDSHKGNGFGGRPLGQCVFLVNRQLIAYAKILLNDIADGIQTSVSVGIHHRFFISAGNGCLRHNSVYLCKMCLLNLEVRHIVDVTVFKNLIYPLWRKLLVFLVRHLFYRISNLFTHFLRNGNSKVLFQNIVDTAFTRLAVDTNNIRIIGSAHIHRVNRQIWHTPDCMVFIL